MKAKEGFNSSGLPQALVWCWPGGCRGLIPTDAGLAVPHPRPVRVFSPSWFGGEGGECLARCHPSPHLLHDEVVEQCHHTDMEGLHPLLPEQAPEHLEAAQLEELLLGIGEVSQHGGQGEESLVERRGQSAQWPWPPHVARPLFMAPRGDSRNTLQPVCAELHRKRIPASSGWGAPPAVPFAIPILASTVRLPRLGYFHPNPSRGCH